MGCVPLWVVQSLFVGVAGGLITWLVIWLLDCGEDDEL